MSMIFLPQHFTVLLNVTLLLITISTFIFIISLLFRLCSRRGGVIREGKQFSGHYRFYYNTFIDSGVNFRLISVQIFLQTCHELFSCKFILYNLGWLLFKSLKLSKRGGGWWLVLGKQDYHDQFYGPT